MQKGGRERTRLTTGMADLVRILQIRNSTALPCLESKPRSIYAIVSN